MKFAILTQYYPPEIGAPQARLSSLARQFVRRGHDVTVLTAMPSYPQGMVYPGYRGLVKRHVLDGVRIVRSILYPTQRTDVARRLANYVSFAASASVIGAACLGRQDYLLVESPPPFLGLTGVWLSRLTGARMIFNVSDLWPESAVSLGVLRSGSLTHRMSEWLEGFCYRHAWLVTGQSREIIVDIAARFPACRTLHLSNGVEADRFGRDRATSRTRQALGADRNSCVALYAGLHGIAQGLDVLVEAAQLLPRESNVDVVLMGDGPTKAALRKTVSVRGLENVRLLDPQPHANMPEFLAAADVIIVPLSRYIRGAVPSKLYEAMATGRPVVLVADGEAAHIVRTHQAGIVVRPGNPRAIAEALSTLARNPEQRHLLGANARRAAVEHFDRTEIAGSFIQYLEADLADAGASSRARRSFERSQPVDQIMIKPANARSFTVDARLSVTHPASVSSERTAVQAGMSNPARNKRHYDEHYASLTAGSVIRRFESIRASWADVLATDTSWRAMYRDGFAARLSGRRVLELGAGNGANALMMASLGACVTAVDIADPPARALAEAARQLNLPVIAVAGDILSMQFDAAYDIVIGKAVLHHLTLDEEAKCLERVAILLTSVGEARFVEPAVNNRLVDALRWMTPVPGRPARWQRSFDTWKAADPHPDRDNSDRHYRTVGLRFFHEAETHCIGGFERLHRLWPGPSRRMRRMLHRLDDLFPTRLQRIIARCQTVVYRRPRST